MASAVVGWMDSGSVIRDTYFYLLTFLGEGEVVKVETNYSSCGGEKPGAGGAATHFRRVP